ncbi:MAG: HIRAN domain-containing protein [Paludibacteraceae bacterium]|nr:HIRAN domain-containing protein [Paludibacteraceae bacterium]
MQAKKLFFQSSHIAGRKYHDADLVFDQLKVGCQLQLVHDIDNRHDPYAVAIIFKDEEGEDYLLGYLPRGENQQIADFLDMGWEELFDCRLSVKDSECRNPEQQLFVTIRINKRKE